MKKNQSTKQIVILLPWGMKGKSKSLAKIAKVLMQDKVKIVVVKKKKIELWNKY
jgi:hypothetical protein